MVVGGIFSTGVTASDFVNFGLLTFFGRVFFTTFNAAWGMIRDIQRDFSSTRKEKGSTVSRFVSSIFERHENIFVRVVDSYL